MNRKLFNGFSLALILSSGLWMSCGLPALKSKAAETCSPTLPPRHAFPRRWIRFQWKRAERSKSPASYKPFMKSKSCCIHRACSHRENQM
jgi:hypothetical protein